MLIFLIIVFIIISFRLWLKLQDQKKENNELTKKNEYVGIELEDYKLKFESLKKYEPIRDIQKELDQITQQIKTIRENAEIEVKQLKGEARAQAKTIKEKAELTLEEAHNLANKIENAAKAKAEEIAGEAWEAKQNADQYSETVKAMRNIIKGYGDEYLIPNRSLLDDLAEEYDHKKAGQELAQVRSLIKSMIKNGEAAECDYVETHRKTTAIEFVLDAFNGKIDSIMSRVKHDNYGKLLQEISDAYRLVNHNGKAFRDARITQRYYDTIIEQLKHAVTTQELKKKDQEEQREIREAMREEEKVRREVEKALREAEKEEQLLAKAMKIAEEKLSKAADEERAKFEEELEEIKRQLAEAGERGQRAISMAQQTKRGHVYIISNIGSFGENVVKIGLTRRLEPLDRVKELGDASVPFSFDVHAMIHSEDAPKLEKELHDTFDKNRLNKVNYRKEFFTIPIHEIRKNIDQIGLETHWTMKAEAQEFRESLEFHKRALKASETEVTKLSSHDQDRLG